MVERRRGDDGLTMENDTRERAWERGAKLVICGARCSIAPGRVVDHAPCAAPIGDCYVRRLALGDRRRGRGWK